MLLEPLLHRISASGRQQPLRGSSLPTNVAFLDAHQSFTGSNTFTGVALLRKPTTNSPAHSPAASGGRCQPDQPRSGEPATRHGLDQHLGQRGHGQHRRRGRHRRLGLERDELIGRLEGDVTGTQDATVVEGLRGVAIAATSPAAHQHLRFDGAQWTPGAVALDSDVSGALPLAHGGTGAATASEARAQLGARRAARTQTSPRCPAW